nr:uncharacterized protein LOC111996965 [Quercus suber]
MTRAQDAFTTEDLQVLSGVPSNEIVGRHIHKLVQVLGETIHITLEYLSQEAKAISAGSKLQGLEAENSKLKKDLILAMDKADTAKKKVRVLSNDLRAERQLTLKKDENSRPQRRG